MRYLEYLNHYSNLLLALLTLCYVALTYQMLKALRRESMREHRLRHLEDIKTQVARPLREWVNLHAVQFLNGTRLPVAVAQVQRPRSKVGLGEPSYETARELISTLVPPFHGPLFWDVKRTHFPRQMEAIEIIERRVQKLCSDYLNSAKRWADEIASTTPLRRVVSLGMPPPFADSDYLVEVHLQHLIAGTLPEFRTKIPAPDALELWGTGGNLIASGDRESVRKWLEDGAKLIRERWQSSPLPARTKGDLRYAQLVADYISRLELTYDLPGDCEYVGGRGLGAVKRGWRWLTAKVRSWSA